MDTSRARALRTEAAEFLLAMWGLTLLLTRMSVRSLERRITRGAHRARPGAPPAMTTWPTQALPLGRSDGPARRGAPARVR